MTVTVAATASTTATTATGTVVVASDTARTSKATVVLVSATADTVITTKATQALSRCHTFVTVQLKVLSLEALQLQESTRIIAWRGNTSTLLTLEACLNTYSRFAWR